VAAITVKGNGRSTLINQNDLMSTGTNLGTIGTSLGTSMGTGAVGIVTPKVNTKVKIIKRYQNRKLYDTQQSCYVTLDDIAKMIRVNEEVMVIDNKSKNDITAATLTQIIFEAEKKASQYAPLFTLREIIQNGNGSISNYLAKLGAFPHDYVAKQTVVSPIIDGRSSTDDLKQNLESRVASAVARVATDNAVRAAAEKATAVLPTGASNEETPNLPTSNFNLVSTTTLTAGMNNNLPGFTTTQPATVTTTTPTALPTSVATLPSTETSAAE
jgi:polyhydroxyalkanoate synthesis repressor PhaR